MIEISYTKDLNFWTFPATWKCIPTNGGPLKKNGENVMGRGLALQFKEKYPSAPKFLGDAIAANGNIFQRIMTGFTEDNFATFYAFPTKDKWYSSSSKDLIARSCQELLAQLTRVILSKQEVPLILLPKVGCGAGGLDYGNDVRPILIEYFNKYDNIIVLI